MKIHLMLMTAMLCFSVANNCEAQDTTKKDKGADCVNNEDCKSNVCTTDKKCAGAALRAVCVADEDCESKKCVVGRCDVDSGQDAS